MATFSLTITVRVRVRWWLPVYLNTVGMLCQIFDMDPNWDRIDWWAARGIHVEIALGVAPAVEVVVQGQKAVV